MECQKQKENNYKGKILMYNKSHKRKSERIPNKQYEDFATTEDIRTIRQDIRELRKEIKLISKQQSSSKGRDKVIFKIIEIAVPAIATVVFGLVGFVIDTKLDISELKTVVGDIREDVKGINIKMDSLNKRVDELEDWRETGALDASDGSTDGLNMASFASVGASNINAIQLSYTKGTKVGTSFDDRKTVYTIGDVIGKPVLLTYFDDTNDNHEVYFYGQFNKNCRWDGQCITNAYYTDTNELYSVCEYNFINGRCVNYKSFFHTYGEKKWIYTERVCTDEGNLGVSDTYIYDCDIVKSFNKESAKIKDLLFLQDFNISNMKWSKHYNGLTSDGYYNDTTGNAYEIEFSKDGFITSLYIGEFENGKRQDVTGDAIEMSYDIDTKKYVYFRGTFEDDGQKQALEKYFVTRQQIDELLRGKTFDIELQWYKIE